MYLLHWNFQSSNSQSASVESNNFLLRKAGIRKVARYLSLYTRRYKILAVFIVFTSAFALSLTCFFLEKFLPKPSHQASDSACKIGFLGRFCKMRICSESGSLGHEMFIMSKRGTTHSQWLRSKVPYSVSSEAHTHKKWHPSGQSFWRVAFLPNMPNSGRIKHVLQTEKLLRNEPGFTKLECPRISRVDPWWIKSSIFQGRIVRMCVNHVSVDKWETNSKDKQLTTGFL